MILLFLVALPPTFAEFAILGYIDFVSIIIAIGITIIATGIKAGDSGIGKTPLSTIFSRKLGLAPENAVGDVPATARPIIWGLVTSFEKSADTMPHDF